MFKRRCFILVAQILRVSTNDRRFSFTAFLCRELSPSSRHIQAATITDTITTNVTHLANTLMFPNNVMNKHASVRKLISFRRRMYCIMFLLLRHYVLPHSGNGSCRCVRTDCLNVRCDFFLVCRVFYVTRTQNRIDSFVGNQSIITVQPHRSQLIQHIQQGFRIGYCNCYPTTD